MTDFLDPCELLAQLGEAARAVELPKRGDAAGEFPVGEQVQVGPMVYLVADDLAEWQASEQDASQHYGYTDHQRSRLLISPSTAREFRPIVVLHEVMHAVAFAAGQVDNRKRREEDWVVMVAPLLLDTLRRNPKLTAWLLAVPG